MASLQGGIIIERVGEVCGEVSGYGVFDEVGASGSLADEGRRVLGALLDGGVVTTPSGGLAVSYQLLDSSWCEISQNLVGADDSSGILCPEVDELVHFDLPLVRGRTAA
ncbi:hypothetical protein [Streptomyces sp. AVP053U2]|uniref:hypothetical protein n=1 Tax=Streptomyces sp. AVP053U2 TaxID=1737066 RepID=UPI00159F2E25|nr:hypothetical protein [Streptomyces sp. AVP053U2]